MNNNNSITSSTDCETEGDDNDNDIHEPLQSVADCLHKEVDLHRIWKGKLSGSSGVNANANANANVNDDDDDDDDDMTLELPLNDSSQSYQSVLPVSQSEG